MRSLELYIKQKLLKHAIGGRNIKILAERKVFKKLENVCHFVVSHGPKLAPHFETDPNNGWEGD